MCVSFNYHTTLGSCMLNYGTHREFNYRLLPSIQPPIVLTDLHLWVYVHMNNY